MSLHKSNMYFNRPENKYENKRNIITTAKNRKQKENNKHTVYGKPF